MREAHCTTEQHPHAGDHADAHASRRLSRSLSKNQQGQDWREKPPAGQLHYLATSRFRELCDERAISRRGFNGPALYVNLKRWHNQGTEIETIEQMMQIFFSGTNPQDFERAGTIAWRLFVSRRASLEQKIKDRSVWKRPEPTGSMEKYLAERARYDERQRQLSIM